MILAPIFLLKTRKLWQSEHKPSSCRNNGKVVEVYVKKNVLWKKQEDIYYGLIAYKYCLPSMFKLGVMFGEATPTSI